MKDSSTVFPDYVDDLNFFQDISIDKLPVMTKYNEMISRGSYSEASEYINQQDVTFYGAWVLNMLENRLIAIEDFIIHSLEKPDLTIYGDIEPTDVPAGYCWT